MAPKAAMMPPEIDPWAIPVTSAIARPAAMKTNAMRAGSLESVDAGAVISVLRRRTYHRCPAGARGLGRAPALAGKFACFWPDERGPRFVGNVISMTTQ